MAARSPRGLPALGVGEMSCVAEEAELEMLYEEEEEEEYEDLRCFSRYCESPVDQYQRHSLSPVLEESGEEEDKEVCVSAGSGGSRSSSCEGLSPGVPPRDCPTERVAAAVSEESELLCAAAVKLRTLATPRPPGSRSRANDEKEEVEEVAAEEVEEAHDEKRPLSSWETLEYLVHDEDQPLHERAGAARQQQQRRRRRSSDDDVEEQDDEILVRSPSWEGFSPAAGHDPAGAGLPDVSKVPWRPERVRGERRAGGREQGDVEWEAVGAARHHASNGRRRLRRPSRSSEGLVASGEPGKRCEEEEEAVASPCAAGDGGDAAGRGAQEGGWALQLALSEAERVQSWLMQAHASLGRCSSAQYSGPRWGRTRDVASQLIDCQSLLTEIERKVLALSTLITQSDVLLEEVRARITSRAQGPAADIAGGDGTLGLDSRAMAADASRASDGAGETPDAGGAENVNPDSSRLTGAGRGHERDDRGDEGGGGGGGGGERANGSAVAGAELVPDEPLLEGEGRPAEPPARCGGSEYVDAQRLRRRAHAEEISTRLRTLKSGLLSLQKVLLDRQTILQEWLRRAEAEGEESGPHEDLVLEEYSERVERLPTGSLLSAGVALTACATVDHNCNHQPQTLRGLLEELKLLLDDAVAEHEAPSARLCQASDAARSEASGKGGQRPQWDLLEQEQQNKTRVLANLLQCRDAGQVPLASTSLLEEAWAPARLPPTSLSRLHPSAGAGDGEVQNGVERHREGMAEGEAEERGEEEEEEGAERSPDPERKRFSALLAASRRLDDTEEALLLLQVDGGTGGGAGQQEEGVERAAQLAEAEELCVQLAELELELRQRSWEEEDEEDAAAESGDERPSRAAAGAGAAAAAKAVLLRLGILEGAVRTSCSALRDGLSRTAEHQRELAALQHAVSSERRSVQHKLQHCADQSPAEQLEVLSDAARSLDGLRCQLAPLRQRQLEAPPAPPAPPACDDLVRIEHVLDTLEEDVQQRRRAATRALAVDRRYERELRALRLLAQLADERLLAAPRLLLTAADPAQAEQRRLALQEFFRRLEERRFGAEEWARGASEHEWRRTASCRARLWARLDSQQESLRAGVADQRWLIQAWQQVEQEHEDLRRQLEHVEGSMAAHGVLEESEEWLSERISSLLRLQVHVEEHLPRASQLLADGKQLRERAARLGEGAARAYGLQGAAGGAVGGPAEGERPPDAPASEGGTERRAAPHAEPGDTGERWAKTAALDLAASPGLTCHLEGFGQRWADCGGRLGAELRRLKALLSHLTRFRCECTELLLWLAEAQGRLDYWSNQADTVAHEPAMAQELIQQFMAFVHEVNARAPVRAAVGACGTRLLRLQQGEATAPRTQLTQLETAWAELTARVPLVQERLRQALAACRPSCQAMDELLGWVDEVERRLASNAGRASGLLGAAELRVLLDEYKGATLDTRARQPLVDGASQALLQQQQQGAAHVQAQWRRRERLRVAESVGALDRRWHALLGRLSVTTEQLETRLEAWTEWETQTQALLEWLETQVVGRLAVLRQGRGGGAAATLALGACSELQDKLKVKVEEVEKLKVAGTSLVPADEKPVGGPIAETLHRLRASCSSVQQQLSEVAEQQRVLAEAWRERDAAHEAVNRALWEAWHGISRARPLSGSAEASQRQMSILQLVRGEGEGRAELLMELVKATEHLRATGCHPSLHARLSLALDDARRSLEELERGLAEGLARAAELLELWAALGAAGAVSRGSLAHLEEEVAMLRATVSPWDLPLEEVGGWLCKCQEMEADANAVESLLAALDARARELVPRVGLAAVAPAQLEGGALAHRLARAHRSLSASRLTLQHGASIHRGLVEGLRVLGAAVEEAEVALGCVELDTRPPREPGGARGRAAEIKLQLLSLAAVAPALEAARADGRQLLLDGSDAQHLRALSARWHRAVSRTALMSRQQQQQWLRRRSFAEKCRCFKRFLLEMEQGLDAEEAPVTEDGLHAKENGNAAHAGDPADGPASGPNAARPGDTTALCVHYENLLERQRMMECLVVKVLAQQALVQEMEREGGELLDTGRVAHGSALGPKLALMAVVWRGAVWRVRHARGELARRVGAWRRCLEARTAAHDAFRRLEAEVTELERPVEAAAGRLSTGLSYAQMALHLEDAEAMTRTLQRALGSRVTALEAALLELEPTARGLLCHEAAGAREQWKQAGFRLHILHQQLTCSLQEREGWERTLENSLEKQALLQGRLFLLPSHEEQQQEQQLQCRELERLVGECAEELDHLEESCSPLELPLSEEDGALLQARAANLRWQWAELQNQVRQASCRASESHEEREALARRDARLCEWLERLEQAVSRGSGQGGLEETLGWLETECKDEVEAAGDCWVQLQAFGNRLVAASGAVRAAEIGDRLRRTEDRWNHLHYFWATRLRRLKDVSGNKQQLDSAMGSLRAWLAGMEAALAQPIVYHDFEAAEIQLKLAQQQELQRDIEEHGASVSSVLSACGALLQDCDACAGKAESDGLSQATRGLERRWRNICATAMERRLRIEDTWRLWQKFQEDHTRLEACLLDLECTAASPSSSLVLYTQAKEELKRFEVVQRRVHESLTQLELVNKQYRRLARENRTDATCCLRRMVLSCNQRWDELQRRVAAILRRLKHFVSQRDEFETTRESLVVWLTQMDLQLTNLEHFSEFDREVKLRQLRAYQQEIELNTARIEELITHAEELIQKSEPLDAAVIEEELEQLRRDWQDVFARVERYLTRIHGLLLVTNDDDDRSDPETEPEELDGIPPTVDGMGGGDGGDGGGGGDDGTAAVPTAGSAGDPCVLRSSAALRNLAVAHPSGRDTPASLEWDYQFDITRVEGAPERGEEEDDDDEDDDGGYDDADGTLTDIGVTETHEAFIAQTESVLRASSDGNGNVLELQLQQLNMALEATRYHLQQTEHFLSRRTPTGPDLDGTYVQYMKLLTECQSSVERVRCMGEALMEGQEEGSHSTGLQQQLSGVFERWEELREQAQAKEQRMATRLQQWRQLDEQARELAWWLDGAQATLANCRASAASQSPQLAALQLSLSQLRELHEDVESRCPLVLSLTLGARELESSCSNEEDDSWSGTDSEVEGTAARGSTSRVHPSAGQTLLQLLPDVLRRWKRLNAGLEEVERTLFDLIRNISASCPMERDEGSRPPVNIDHQIRSGRDGAERVAATAVPWQNSAPARCTVKEATPRSFARRVVFASLPFHLMLILMLLLLVCLMPSMEENPICAHVNNFARSFHPMLIYTNGPPPT